jgi:CRP-like cAMP-binding protein
MESLMESVKADMMPTSPQVETLFTPRITHSGLNLDSGVLISSLPVFSSPDRINFLESLVTLLHSRKYSVGDIVLNQGDASKAVFFILKGELLVVSPDKEVELSILPKGSFCNKNSRSW